MTDNKFNTELSSLIKQAKENGYELKDNQFVKVEVENGKVPVIEILFINNSTIEEAGECRLYHRTAVIEKDEYDSIAKYGLHNNYHAFYCNTALCDIREPEEYEDEMIDLIYDIFYKYDKSGLDYQYPNKDKKITVEYSTDYNVYSDADTCIDFWFSKMDSNSNFPIGSISFYYMEMNDFERRKNTDVDIKIKKFMRWN